ncbi:shikimate kinase [Mesorhizobium sp. BR1-1-16]|uniref:shikimate kinase n=1 Tax=Mesorhizobium sp. BR1-1-16 TaxID=2876653 RepID=UPI001CC9E84A|nr:shikimate kinase [Mesorhizobium sp. BR1-1-16]MBZ9937390.1 shikimate kinase [Mesorhizobium sp. BR1-1-16]
MQQDALRGEEAARSAAGLVEQLGGRAIVLVGLMGAGKTSVGKRLATRLQLPFVDADAEIEKAAAATIPEIFAKHGEAYFRDGERRVIRRLLDRRPKVLATGGGAFMSAETRAAIAADGVSIWLRAELDILMARVRKRSNRPLLHTEDPEATMRRLMEERYPVYATADIHVVSRDVPHEIVAEETLTALASFLAAGSPDERPPT